MTYPLDWSTKAAAPLRPHLTTVDAIVLAARLAEIHISTYHRLDAAARSRIWLRRLEIRAGRAPVEDGLDALPVAGTLTPADQPPAYGAAVSVWAGTVASMAVRCLVEHDVADGAPGALPGRDALRAPVIRQRPEIADLVVQPGLASAQITVAGSAAGLSFVDSFVVALQLGQVLLYQADGVARADSNTLWMRQTVLERDAPPRAGSGPFPVAVTLAGSELLTARGRQWRVADVVGIGGGVRVRCNVTHQLPALERTA